MAIARWDCFDYVAEFEPGGFKGNEVTLRARSREGSVENVLIGHNPRLRFWNERLILIAAERFGATVRWVSFPVGDVVLLVAQPGDSLHVVLTSAADLALSILRGGDPVLALGALTEVLLGDHVRVTCHDEDSDGIEEWVRVWVGPNHIRLGLRESGTVGEYEVYVERIRTAGIDPDGVDECGSIVRAGDSTRRNAAVRAAVLLAHERLGTLQGERWDGTFIR